VTVTLPPISKGSSAAMLAGVIDNPAPQIITIYTQRAEILFIMVN
jgi:hypothetical protein